MLFKNKYHTYKILKPFDYYHIKSQIIDWLTKL